MEIPCVHVVCSPPFIIPVDVVPWLSAGCPVMGILIGHSWPQQDYVIPILLLLLLLLGGQLIPWELHPLVPYTSKVNLKLT